MLSETAQLLLGNALEPFCILQRHHNMVGTFQCNCLVFWPRLWVVESTYSARYEIQHLLPTSDIQICQGQNLVTKLLSNLDLHQVLFPSDWFHLLWCWASPIPPSAAINKGVSGVRFPTVLNSARKHWPGFLDRALRHLQQLAMNETYFDNEIIETTLLTKEKPCNDLNFLRSLGPTQRDIKSCASVAISRPFRTCTFSCRLIQETEVVWSRWASWWWV